MPPKKMGVNSKAEAARERRSAAEAERKEKEARQKDDQYWNEAEGAKSRAAKKKEEEAEKRASALARKAEIRRLAEQEQVEIEKAGKKPDKKANRVAVPVPKVTSVVLERRREEERERLLRNAEVEKKKVSRTAAEEEYERVVMVSNTNRDDSIIEARSVDEAIRKMVISEPVLLPDRHPERRLKSSFKCDVVRILAQYEKLLPHKPLFSHQEAFEEAELPKLKEEKPGLTLNQYKDMIWKMWKKSPDNPLNQVAE